MLDCHNVNTTIDTLHQHGYTANMTRRDLLSEGVLWTASAPMMSRLVCAQETVEAAGRRKSSDRQMARTAMAQSVFSLAIDYWTFVQNAPYGSGATRENLLPALRSIKPGFLFVYAKGESGHTTFRSSLRSEHQGLAKDYLKFHRGVCDETGTRLALYYSGLEDGVAGGQHAEWCLLGPDRKPVVNFAGLAPSFALTICICPLSRYLEDWLAVHFREMFAIADPDALWIDGTWVGPCYCSRCIGRYRKESGFKGETPEGREWNNFFARVMFEWRERVQHIVRTFSPTCLVTFGNVAVRPDLREDRDWLSGDLYSPNNHRLCGSIAARRYTTTGLHYDAWLCDTHVLHARPEFRARTKSLPRILQEGAGLLANGGSWVYWTFPLSNGALIPSRMRRARLAAEFARQREHVCLNTRSAQWTGILDLGRTKTWRTPALLGAGKALIELHRSPDLLDEQTLSLDAPYDLLIVPEQEEVSDVLVSKLEAFVRRGGKLLTTGSSGHAPAMQRLAGIRLIEENAVKDGGVLLKDGEPAVICAPWDRFQLLEAREFASLYLPFDSRNEVTQAFKNLAIYGMLDEEHPEPAGLPAATVRKLGEGMALHIPTSFFDVFSRYGNRDMLAFLRQILGHLQPNPMFSTDALSFVEISLRKKDRALLVHFVNGNPGRDLSAVGTDDLWVDDIPAVGPITCRILCARRPSQLHWEPGRVPVSSEWTRGILTVTLPRLEIHTCLVISDWEN